MSVAATRRELDKVRLESRRGPRRDESESASDTESDVTELPEGEDEPEYYPDAIKWARYRNSHRDRSDGYTGWHYGVMWAGYLKSFSDTEEPLASLETDDGVNQILEEFWMEVGRPMKRKEDGEGMEEPEGKLREVVYPPEDLMKRWLAEARPRRSYKLFKIRERKEQAIPPQKIQKRDSDYYWYRDLKAKAKAKAEREAARVAAGEAGPSRLPRIPKNTPSTINTPVDSDNDEEGMRKAEERSKKAGSASLGALFEDEAEAQTERERRRKEVETLRRQVDSLFSEDEEEVEEPTRPQSIEATSNKKRKAGDRTPDVGPSNDQGRPSPPKKQKSPTPTPAPAPSSIPVPFAPAPAPSSVPVPLPCPPPSGPIPTPDPPASAPIPIPTRAPAPSTPTATNASQSPTSPRARMSVQELSNRLKNKEPLFLSGGGSPVDTATRPLSPVDTFGEPLPGIFFRPSYMGAEPEPSPSPSPIAEVKPDITADVPRLSKSPTPSAPPQNGSAGPSTSGSTSTQPPAPKSVSPPTPAPNVNQSLAPAAPVTIQVTSPTPRPSVKASQAGPSTSTSTLQVNSTAPRQSSPSSSGVGAPPITPVTSTSPIGANDTAVQKAVTPPTPVTSAPAPAEVAAAPEEDIAMPSPTTESLRQTSPGPTLPLSPDTATAPPLAQSLSISPPRYNQVQNESSKSPKSPTLLTSPRKSASLSLSPTGSTSSSKPAGPISDRPKYVQPKLVKVMDAIVDPEAEARMQKLAARKNSQPTSGPSTLPARPSTIVPPTGSKPQPPTSGPPRPPPSLRSPIHTPNRPPPGPSSAPIQPKSWGAQPPSGPSAMQARPAAGYGQVGTGPLADQKDAYKSNKSQAPWVQRQQNGGASPAVPYHNASPMWNGAGSGGASPIVHTDRWTPNTPAPPQMSNLSPQWTPSSSYNNIQPPPGFPGHRPTYQTAPPQAVDPRSASASPMIHNASPMGQMGNQTPIPQAADPRRPSFPPQTPLQNVPRSPEGERSSASGSRRIDKLGRVALRLDYQDHVHHLDVTRGAWPGQLEDGDAVLAQLLGDGSTEISLSMDDVDLSLVNWQIKHFGARVVQWAKLGCPDADKGRRSFWDKLKMQSHLQGKAWVTYTELPFQDESITAHYALIVTDSKNVQSELLGPGLGLGPWTSTKEAGIALLVLALPLDSVDPPMLPDPVRPDALGHDMDIKPKQDMLLDQMHLLASYGLTPQYFDSLAGRPAVTYPPKDGDYDVLKTWIGRQYQYKGVKPHDAGSLPDQVLFDNAKMGRAVKSSTMRQTVNRRTQYFAAGPSLHLPPSQWGLTEIWKTGGVVTFSPTFILRNPKKFGEIMQVIRSAPNWAAYVIPELVQWVETSWKKPTRCPRPTEAFQVFSKSLILDRHLLHLSGSRACSGGGLAISTCPPLNSEIDKCATWLDWLARIVTQTEYKALVKLCFEYTAGKREHPIPKKGEMDMDVDEAELELDLDLVDIETKQIEDLTHMRMRPHSVPYRRFIYIGDVSLGAEKRNRLATGIECVDPDSFAALLSGAI